MSKRNNNDDISFLGKIVLIFRSVKDKLIGLHLFKRIFAKQREISGYGEGENIAETKLSYTFSILKVCSLSLLCFLLVFTLIFGGSIISYENVYYMFKDIGYISSFSESRPEMLNYTKPFDNQDFAAFKNGLAVASDSEIKLFTSTGRTTLSIGSSFTNPKICTSNANVLIYDQGRHEYSVYNSFTSVHSETLQHPIAYADMSDDGSYCLVTRSGDYGSTVKVYNNKFAIVTEYFKNDHIISAELSPNGRFLTVLSISAEGGKSKTELNVLKIGNKSPLATVVLYDKLPYTVKFLSNERIALISSDHSSVYDVNGVLRNSFAFPDQLTHMSFTNGGYALVFANGEVKGSNTVAAFDSNGNLTYTEIVENSVRDMQIVDNYIYLVSEHELKKIDVKLRSIVSREYSAENGRLIIFPGGDVMVCFETNANYISFAD